MVEASDRAGRRTLRTGPTVEDGTLVWGVDFSDNPVRFPVPGPVMIHLPFALASFQPSLIGPDDDGIDLDVVRRTVIGTAQPPHPGSVVEGSGSIFRRVPRQRGVSVSWFVEIDGQTVAFVSIVAGLGDEVIVQQLRGCSRARGSRLRFQRPRR